MRELVSGVMDRRGSVLMLFVVLAAAYLVLDALFVVVAEGVPFLEALLAPGTREWFDRLLVVAFGLAVAVSAELALDRYRATAGELENERRNLRALYEHHPSAIVTLDRDLDVRYANLRTSDVVGRPRTDLVGTHCYRSIMGLEEPCDGCLVAQVFETGSPHSRIKHEVTVAGKENWLSQLWYPLLDEEGAVESVVEIASDVSELRLDALTGLPNRLLFRDRLDVALAGAARRSSRLALLFLDIDGFKEVNDQMGHAAGDRLLTGVAERMRGIVRQDETLGRLGGDEFVLLVPSLEESEEAVRLAERVLGQVRPPFVVDGRQVPVTLSIGICICDCSAEAPSAGELMREADEAMYRAKERGGDGLELVTIPRAAS
jgi:diguanylate cyclase (GGDEF)-like protein